MLFGIWCLASTIWRVCDVVLHCSRALLDASFEPGTDTSNDEIDFRTTTAYYISKSLGFAYEPSSSILLPPFSDILV